MQSPTPVPQLPVSGVASDSSARHSRIAIIGNGVSALTALSIFQAEGLSRDELAVYGDQTDPFANLCRYTRAIEQDRMRSESSGHFFPTDFPGLALLESLRNHTLWPLLLSLFDQYQPRLADLLAHGELIARAGKPARLYVRTRVARVAQHDKAGFVLYDSAGQELGSAQHVILALGYPGLRWPEPLVSWRADARVAHAYQRKCYRAGETVLVVGAGMAAAHEWQAALRAGCRVVAISRHPFHYQPLNAQRCDFSAAGLDLYRRLNAVERHAYLDQVASGSYPWRLSWEWDFARARRRGDWRSIEAEVLSIEQSGDALSARLSNGDAVRVDRVVAATGFIPNVMAHPLVAQLASSYALPIERGRLIVNDDFTVPLIGGAQTRLAVIGNLARWALPIADTFTGMKYVARRLRDTFGITGQPLQRIRFSLRLMRTRL